MLKKPITMTPCNNPSLYEEARNKPSKIVPLLPRESLLDWLEISGRFQPDDVDEFHDYKLVEELDSFLESENYDPDDDEEEELE